MPTDATATEHPTDRSNAFVVTSSWLSRRHFLLLLPPPRSLLFHPCIGFGLHRAATTEKTYDSAETGSSIYIGEPSFTSVESNSTATTLFKSDSALIAMFRFHTSLSNTDTEKKGGSPSCSTCFGIGASCMTLARVICSYWWECYSSSFPCSGAVTLVLPWAFGP